MFKIEKDTLFLARHFKYINNRIFKLIIPPIHLHGDEKIELEALKECLSLGISSNVSLEYAKKHGLKHSKVSQYEGGREVIYERDMSLKGKSFANVRNERNNFLKRVKQGEIEIAFDYPYEKLSALNDLWVSQKGRDYGEYGYVIKNIDMFKDHVRNMTLLSEGVPIASELYVCFNDHTWYCSSAISDYNNPLSYGAQRQMYINVFDFVDGLQRVLPGGWTEQGLRRAKLSIPNKVLTKARATPFIKLDDDYWLRIESLKGKGETPKVSEKESKKVKDWHKGCDPDFLLGDLTNTKKS